MYCNTDEEKFRSKHHGLKKTRTKYCFFMIGFSLAFGPYLAMLVLQSSINIEDSVGTIALGVAYMGSIFAAVFITPIAVRRLGSKWVIIIGEVSYFLFVAANFYPTKYVMLCAGIIVGIGEALVWTTAPMYCAYFGYLHGQDGTKTVGHYVQKYMSLFYVTFQICQIVGCAISYAVLFGAKNKTHPERHVLYNDTTESMIPMSSKYQFCGAHDCQSANLTQENIDKYIPADSVSLYILISIFCVLSICGVCFHIRFLPNVTTKNPKSSRNDENVKCLEELKTSDYKSTLWATCKHILNTKQILISPLLFYNGMYIAFTMSEILRAYVSCILGVEQIGATVIVFAVASGISSTITGKSIIRFGRNKVMLVLMILDICNYSFCLFWKINEETKYLVYLLFLLFGSTDSAWKLSNLDIIPFYFHRNQEISYSIWNVWLTLGIAFGFLWSPLVCVEIKIYFHIGLLLFSMICYGFAECIHRNEKSATSLS